jgi:hypothetical protein
MGMTMTKTKKLLAAFDVTKPDARPGELVVPWVENGLLTLIGLRSGVEYSHGVVVHVGREVTEQDVFSALVDGGRNFVDVDQCLGCIRRFLSVIPEHKIGTVVRLGHGSGNGFDFQFVPVKNNKGIAKSKLPS